MKFLLLVGLLLILASCRPSSMLAPTIDATPDAYCVDAGALSLCDRACLELAVLGCPESSGRPDGGESCGAFCERTEEAGIFSVHPACIADASTVGAARACGIRCVGR